MLRLAAALCVAATTAQADRLSILLGSNHVGATASDNFKEDNLGVFYTREGEIDWSVGVFENSYEGTSIALAAGFELFGWDNGELSLVAGVATYPGHPSGYKFLPVGGLQLRQGYLWAQVTPMDGKPVDLLIAGGITVTIEP